MRRRLFRALYLPIVALVIGWFSVAPATACGGFFCQTLPVDQVAERILFTVNDDETITSLIEISYIGEADDFSWILPIPEAIGPDDLQVPDEGDSVFDELHSLTDVQFIPPRETACVDEFRMMAATAEDDSAEGGVEVFASGEVGPFGFDVIGSDDPAALTNWLRDNDYRVDASMEPLINVYVEDEFAFVAMRLLDGETSESITPIEITYPGTAPMIPIRLTAVAALPQMPIYVWILSDQQAVPANYAHFDIATEEVTFSGFGFNDYTQLVQARADAVGGQGFITEFAGPANSIRITNPYLSAQAEEQPYLTRLATYLDPEEMTVDPVFEFDADRGDVSNIRDASELVGLYDCERDLTRRGEAEFGGSDAVDATIVNVALANGSFDGYDDDRYFVDGETNPVTVDETMDEDADEIEETTGESVEVAVGETDAPSDNNERVIGLALLAAFVAAIIGLVGFRLGANRE